MPASLTRPMSCPCQRRLPAEGAGVKAGLPVVAFLVHVARQFLQAQVLQRLRQRHFGIHALEVGTGGFGVLADPVGDALRPGAACPSGSTSDSGAWLSQPKSSGAGTRNRRPLGRWLGAGSQQPGRRRRGSCGRCGSAAGRPGRSGRRCRSAPAGRCPGPRFWRCRRSRRAVRPADRLRSRRRQTSGPESAPAPAPGPPCFKTAFLANHSHRRLENHRLAAHAGAVAGGARVIAGLAQRLALPGRPPGPSRSPPPRGKRVRATALCLGQRQAQRQVPGCFAGLAVSSTSGDTP